MRCVFLGYGSHQKGYRCYNPSTKKTYVTMDVTFLETESFFQDTTSSFQGEMQTEKKNWWETGSGIMATGGVQINRVLALRPIARVELGQNLLMDVEQEGLECEQGVSEISRQIHQREVKSSRSRVYKTNRLVQNSFPHLLQCATQLLRKFLW